MSKNKCKNFAEKVKLSDVVLVDEKIESVVGLTSSNGTNYYIVQLANCVIEFDANLTYKLDGANVAAGNSITSCGLACTKRSYVDGGSCVYSRSRICTGTRPMVYSKELHGRVFKLEPYRTELNTSPDCALDTPILGSVDAALAKIKALKKIMPNYSTETRTNKR